MRSMPRPLNYIVAEARTGEAALIKLRNERCDLLLLDLVAAHDRDRCWPSQYLPGAGRYPQPKALLSGSGPIFSRHSKPDREWRIAVLYFIRGWQCRDLAGRFEITPERVRQILGEWKRRAVQLGFIQSIPPDQPMKKPQRIPKESVKG
jgi:hypothetical protein